MSGQVASCRRGTIDMLLKRFIEDDRGATAIEYALIGVLISVAIVSGLQSLSGEVQDLFARASEGLEQGVEP